MQSEELVEKIAKALAMEMYPDTRWPADENDADCGVDDREGRYPVSWHYVQTCRRQAKVALAALSTDAQPVAYRRVSLSGICDFIEAHELELLRELGSAENFEPLYTSPPAPSVAVKALESIRAELRVDTSNGSPGSISYEVGALHRIVAAVDAALSAQVQDVAGWQDISTAPKDGSDLLLSAASWHGDVVVGCWSFEGWRDRDDADSLDPTHWMPLPAAPAAKLEGKP